ncbi:MAG: hypothetical protein ABUL63_05995, partial [Acidobacteriota bacterium]
MSRLFLSLLAGMALAMPEAAAAVAVPIPDGRPAFRFFGFEHGLPQITPQTFAVDTRGFLWTGTQDGAAVYNGRV